VLQCDWFLLARLVQGSRLLLQAAVWLRLYWVMIAVKISLTPRGRAAPAGGGAHSTSASGARRVTKPDSAGGGGA
jgi:hypothetical protein